MATDASPERELFKCSCDGENSDCIRCNGIGWTERPLPVRTGGLRAPRNPNPEIKSETFQTQKEKLFARQVSNELPRLRQLFLQQVGVSAELYIAYLARLIDIVNPEMHFFVTGLGDGDLRAFAKSLERFVNGPSVRYRILANAAHACLLEYERALVKKKSQATPARRLRVKTTDLQKIGTNTCRQCHRVVHDLQSHIQLFHPSLAAPDRVKVQEAATPVTPQPRITRHANSAATAPPNEAVAEEEASEGAAGLKAAPTIIRPEFKLLECPHCGAHVRSHKLSSHINRRHQRPISSSEGKKQRATQPSLHEAGKPAMASRKRSASGKLRSKNKVVPRDSRRRNRPSTWGLDTEISRDRVDTGRVERAMDARRTWGGRFRDTNGTFGSYPLHDNMDDESNAG